MRSGQFIRLTHAARHQKVHHGAERFDQIVRQIESVQCAAVVQAQRRQKTVYGQIPRDAAPQDRIAVVQPRVDAVILSAGKTLPECSCTVKKQATENNR